MPPEPTDSRREFVPAPFWLAFWLAVPLVAAKAYHWGWPGAGDWGLTVWLRDVYVSAHADVAFAVAFGLLALALLGLARRHPRLRRAVALGLLALGAACALYAVASVRIFEYLRSPLTYPLLYLAGDMRTMRSSIGSFTTPGVAATLAIVPAGYLLMVWLCSRPGPRPARPGRRAAATILLAAAAFWAWNGASRADGEWSDRPDLLISRSPHWEFLSSVAAELGGGADGPQLPGDFPPELLADFRPVPRGAIKAAAATGRRRPTHVFVVVLETTGTKYLSLYGSPYPTTKHLEAAAAHAVVFDNFYAHVGLTANSLFAILLSAHPYMTWREYTQEYPEFPGTTLAEVLKPQGYRTAFLTSSFLDYVGQDRFLRNRGFDEVLDWRGLSREEEVNSWGGTEEALVDGALARLDAAPGQSSYTVLWTVRSHHPYDPAPGQPIVDFFAGRKRPPDDYDLGRYLNTLAEADRQLGRLLDGLRERGLDRESVVLVTGDHGEAFGDPHPTWGHGFRLYDEGIKVPLVIWSPGLVPRGRRVATVGGHVDLGPTILDLLGLPAPATWEGRSLFAEHRPPRAYFYAANDDYLLGVREGDFKYIYNATRGREELYDLVRDPDERTNVAAAHPATCRQLRQRLAAWKHHAAERLAQAQGPQLADLGR